MEKEIDDIEGEDFNIEELLGEEEDSPVEDVPEEVVEKEKKSRGRPRGAAKKVEIKEEVPVEVSNTEKDLLGMEWQSFSQPAYDGYQNNKTGEVIDDKEALRRCLCYSQEAARNSR